MTPWVNLAKVSCPQYATRVNNTITVSHIITLVIYTTCGVIFNRFHIRVCGTHGIVMSHHRTHATP